MVHSEFPNALTQGDYRIKCSPGALEVMCPNPSGKALPRHVVQVAIEVVNTSGLGLSSITGVF